MSAAFVAAAFGFALPHLTSYQSVWASLAMMTWPRTLLVATAAAVLLYCAVTYLPPIPLGALACLAWRHAPALISPGSNARRRPLSPPRPALALGGRGFRLNIRRIR